MAKKKNQPQPTVTAKSKRTIHYTGTLQQRDSSNRRVKDENFKDRGGEETMVRLHQVFGGITPTTSGFRETVREQSQETGRNPLTYQKKQRSDTLSVPNNQKRVGSQVGKKISGQCDNVSYCLEMYCNRSPRNKS